MSFRKLVGAFTAVIAIAALSACSSHTVSTTVAPVAKASVLMFQANPPAPEGVTWSCNELTNTGQSPANCFLSVKGQYSCEMVPLAEIDPALAKEANTYTAAAKALYGLLTRDPGIKLRKILPADLSTITTPDSSPVTVVAQVPSKEAVAVISPASSLGFIGESGFTAPSAGATASFRQTPGLWAESAATTSDKGVLGMAWTCSLFTYGDNVKYEDYHQAARAWVHDALALVKGSRAADHGKFTPLGGGN